MTCIAIIENMLAPGIMISACGLLLLGMNNKYSLVVSRIRQLNSEFRNLPDKHSDESNNKRKTSIEKQISMLYKRVKLIKNTVWLYTLAVALFVFSILCIGANFILSSTGIFSTLTMIFFILAIIFVLIGVLYAANETQLGYKIIREETAD